MTDSLFNKVDADPVVDPEKNWLEELVGDGKKFKDPVELARGKAEADAFIARLTREQEELRRELNTRITLEQYLDKMGTPPGPSDRSGDQMNEPKVVPPEQPLKPEDIERLIETKVVQREQQRIQSQNKAEVQVKLVQAFGDNYVPKLQEVATSLGLTPEAVDRMAAETPKALLKLLGADQPGQPQSSGSLFVPPTNSVRPSGPSSGERTMKFYQDLRAKDPKTYHSAANQNRMHQDALKLGEKFFDT